MFVFRFLSVLSLQLSITGTVQSRGILLSLDGGNRPSQGTLSVNYRKRWWAMCSYRWGAEEATTVCRQLGYNSTRVLASTNGFYGPARGTFFDFEFSCQPGTEYLSDCSSERLVYACDHHGEAGVDCDPEDDVFQDVDVRMVNKTAANTGAIEIKYEGVWGTVCGETRRMSWWIPQAEWACKKLGYKGKALPIPERFPRGDTKLWQSNLDCPDNMTSMAQCIVQPWGNAPCFTDKMVGVVCDIERVSVNQNLQIKLTDGLVENTGILQVYQYGVWNPFCEGDVSFAAANLLCQKLGYRRGGLYFPPSAPLWEPTYVSWRVNISCDGSEENFEDCIRGDWTVKICKLNTVWLTCFNSSFPGKPQIIGDTSGLQDGEPVTLKCTADVGHEVPTLSWRCPDYHNHTSETDNNTVSSMLRLDARPYMDGETCTCLAETPSKWSAKASQPIRVSYGPVDVRMDVPDQAIERDNFTAECVVTGSLPEPLIFWYQGDILLKQSYLVKSDFNKSIGFSVKHGINVTTNIALAEHGLKCLAYNPRTGATKWTVAKPVVHIHPRISAAIDYTSDVSGSRAIFTCIVTSPFNGTRIWLGPQNSVISPIPNFVLSNPSVNDNGTYTCIAKGEVLTKQATAKLYIPTY